MVKNIEITIKSFSALKKIIGTGSLELLVPEQSTVSDVVNILVKKYGQGLSAYFFDNGGKIEKYLMFFINGKPIYRLNKLETVLNAGDSLAIVEPLGDG